jgi:hypothetical protein
MNQLTFGTNEALPVIPLGNLEGDRVATTGTEFHAPAGITCLLWKPDSIKL